MNTGLRRYRAIDAGRPPRVIKMAAKYPGVCSATGKAIKPGDQIEYSPSTRTAKLVDQDSSAPDEGRYISNVIRIGGNEYYRNKNGRCIDSPCCGCCTI